MWAAELFKNSYVNVLRIQIVYKSEDGKVTIRLPEAKNGERIGPMQRLSFILL